MFFFHRFLWTFADKKEFDVCIFRNVHLYGKISITDITQFSKKPVIYFIHISNETETISSLSKAFFYFYNTFQKVFFGQLYWKIYWKMIRNIWFNYTFFQRIKTTVANILSIRLTESSEIQVKGIFFSKNVTSNVDVSERLFKNN